jgi:hypothetical protein
VRDPRKKSLPSIRPTELAPQEQHHQLPPLPFLPKHQQQQSIGSSLGSMVLTGAGMSLGFILVGAIFGGF